MKETEFSTFAQKMATIFQGDKTPDQFTKSLFSAIYIQDADEDPVDELLPRSYKSYFYGENNITSLATKISHSLDPTLFAEEFSLEADGSIEALCDLFKDDCPNINPDNYSNVLAEKFKQIILTAASRTKNKQIANKITKNKLSPKDKFGSFLIAESYTCPNDGCSRPLYTRDNGNLNMIFDVVVIDPDEDADNTDNLIAMCPNCCAKYLSNRTPEKINRMKIIKKAVLASYEAQEVTGDQSLEEGVRMVIEQIAATSTPTDVDLNFDPVPIRKKIEDGNHLLYTKAKMHVNLYYHVVNDAFIALSNEKKLRFTPFCQQVRMNYLALKENGYDQNTIYHHMTKWLCDTTNGNWNACEIIISYFIQKCEVFDVIAK